MPSATARRRHAQVMTSAADDNLRPLLQAVHPARLAAAVDYAMDWDDLTVPLARECPPEPTLTMACLGRQGSWGNAVLQYVFLRCFSRAHGFRWQTPRWIGNDILGPTGPAIDFRAPAVVGDGVSTHCAVYDRQLPFDRDLLRATHLAATSGRRYFLLREPALAGPPAEPWPFTHADLEGFFFVAGHELAPHRELVRSLFRPLPAIEQRVGAAVEALRRGAETLVGIHVRRSDFLTLGLRQGFELLTPTATLLAWLDGLWPTLRQPRLVVCTDSPAEVLPAFARFAPLTARDVGCDLSDLVGHDGHAWSRADHGVARAAGFFPDWSVLTRCDVLAVSNSSFSYSAALMNERAQRFVRPTFPHGDLQPFDPWDAEPLLFLPKARSLPGLAMQRLRLTRRGLRGEPRRYWRRSVRRIAGDLLWVLAWRAFTCYRLKGAGRLTKELLSPGFYWQLERKYMASANGGPLSR